MRCDINVRGANMRRTRLASWPTPPPQMANLPGSLLLTRFPMQTNRPTHDQVVTYNNPDCYMMTTTEMANGNLVLNPAMTTCYNNGMQDHESINDTFTQSPSPPHATSRALRTVTALLAEPLRAQPARTVSRARVKTVSRWEHRRTVIRRLKWH